MPSSSANLTAASLAARDARHVGQQGLDLRDAVFLEELPDRVFIWIVLWRARAPRRRRRRTARAKMDSTSPATRVQLHRERKPGPLRTRKARPDRRRAGLHVEAVAEALTPCACSELTGTRSAPAIRRSSPPGRVPPRALDRTASRAVLLVLACPRSRHLLHFCQSVPRSDVHLLETAADREQRMPAATTRGSAAACGVACGSCSASDRSADRSSDAARRSRDCP